MSSTTSSQPTPMMQQWQACKEAAGNAILFFRMGDFYEAFHEDAALIAKELDLTLTRRQDIPMSGVPFHSCEPHIDKLVSKGYRVAIAEQTEDPKKTKGLVKREVVRVVTPGTLITSSLLSDKTNNYCAAVCRVGNTFGLAYLDITTADFRVIEFPSEQSLLEEIFRLKPSEIICAHKFHTKQPEFFELIKQEFVCLITTHDDWRFEHQTAHDFLIGHLAVHSLDGFGLKGMIVGINAAGALLNYIQEALSLPIDHIKEIRTYSSAQFMSLDRMTQTNLELTEPLREGSRRYTLLGLLDKTCTPMGGRLMRHWIKQPLLSSEIIKHRQDILEIFTRHSPASSHLKTLLEDIRDLERLMMRVCSNYASPKDLVALRRSFEPIGRIKAVLQSLPKTTLLQQHEEQMQALPQMTSLIAQAIVDEPPLRLSDGNVIRDGFNAELDELRSLHRDSQAWLLNYQQKLRDETGIKTLKTGFNRMFGYYIEISKGQAERAPESFQRRQTLANAERFITPELKAFETKILTAEERTLGIEAELFQGIRLEVSRYANAVMATAQAIAHIDSHRSLAEVALQHGYVRPIVDDSNLLQITQGRHPVIEASSNSDKFIPNDSILDDHENRLLLITGPNMAGKSTFIRQVALIVIMAQIGSFVPAQAAQIGVVDKVFTRIGASDDLSRGQSTFMVEMTETANILINATSKSLVILDEIGRGTSTYDGISIAWAVAEQLLLTEGKSPKTLFATHYWELTKLEEKIPGAVNYCVAVHENKDQILFLRKIIRGSTDKSYGIHVAKLAGMPLEVVNRAKEILCHLEENSNRKGIFEPSKPRKPLVPKPKALPQGIQLTLFELPTK